MGENENEKAPFQIKIDPEQVNRLIADAVLKSSIGPEINAAVEKYLKKFESTWNFRSHIESVVHKEISNEIQRLIRESSPQIREFVTENMTDEIMTNILKRMWEKWERGY